ncbi:ankyrin repeat-containing protein At5g02620-like [Salvia hispanica]|uniref:ankyrin repeat-containing protein At5g02620-like n=1 Tax=Salvia hispanica TaxID=49212 RepID=UPI002009BC43|nr:ankyrin repeat-containing protein At5g02620-like [Salvia hispanica]
MLISLQQTSTKYVNSSSQRKRRQRTNTVLHEAALKGDWNAVEELLTKNKDLAKTAITEGGEIILHIAALEGHKKFVSKLLEIIEIDDMAAQNAKGCTALCFAAAAGHTKIAEIMLKKHPKLANIKGEDGVWPLYMAALQGFGEMADFLYHESKIGSWTPLDKINLLTTAIDSELFDLAIKILDEDNTLAIAEDSNGETPLQVLARKPLTFSHNNGQGFWTKIVQSYTKKSKNAKCDAYTLMDRLWDAAESCKEDIESCEEDIKATIDSSKLFFIAAESGNDDFLAELFQNDHNLLYKVNKSSHSIFHVAVLHRYPKVFNLMYELGGTKDLIASYIDNDGNNILHLAGRLAPQNQLDSIPGAAMQMQREVLWFKVVEKLVRPAFKNKKNSEGKTPHELFTSEHKELRKKAEEFMKQTAKSCMLVTMLVATVVFTTAFTVPGNNRILTVFSTSEVVVMFSLLTSMLMFLSLLTSRYSDEDFLKKLPLCLAVGLSSLFVSILAMDVAYINAT